MIIDPSKIETMTDADLKSSRVALRRFRESCEYRAQVGRSDALIRMINDELIRRVRESEGEVGK